MLDNTSKWSHPRGNTVVPSRWQVTQNIGILWTILLGALGAGIGSWIASALGLGTILYWVIGILLAMVFIAIYIGATNKGGAARR